MEALIVICKVCLIVFITVIVLNYMAFMSQEIERIRINTDLIVQKERCD